MKDPIIIVAIILGIILILGTTFTFIFLKKRKNKLQYSENIINIINNLGGNENIISVTPKRSRVEFVLNNYDLVNKEELKKLGVQGISKTSQKITLIVGNELAEDLNKEFKYRKLKCLY